MLDCVDSVVQQYLKLFNRVQTNELCEIVLLVLNCNTWNHLTVYKNWILVITYQYLEPFNCVQKNE